MKPVRAYASLYKVRNKVNLLLFICLLAQIFFLLTGSQRIPLPSKFAEIVVNSLLPNDILIKLERPEIIGFSVLECGKAEIWAKGSNILEIKDLSISLNPSGAMNKALFLINKIEFSSANFLKEEKMGPEIEIKQFSLKNRSQEETLFLKGNIFLGSLQSSIHLELRKLNRLFNQGSRPGQKPIPLEKFLEHAIAFKKNLLLWNKKFPVVHVDARGVLNGQMGEVLISQQKGEGKKIKDLLARLSWNKPERGKNLTVASIEATAETIKLNNAGMELSFFKPYIKANSLINLETLKISGTDSFASFQNLFLQGKMTGNINEIFIYSKSQENFTDVQVLSDTNQTRICLNARIKPHKWGLQGSMRISPKNFDLFYDLPQGNLKVLDGDQFSLHFWSNPTPIRQNQPVQFLLDAKKFSVLETPPGKFRVVGEIAEDFTIWVNQAYGNLGKSKVTGKYYQKWNPHKYRFLIEGTCHPPDINNWLGLWWKPIWKEFSFSETIPKGNFSISGIWAGPPGNSLTKGWIKTDKLGYRGFELDRSSIEVEVDKTSTRLKAKNIKHKFGQANGTLVFPRTLEKSNLSMDFSFKGDYPVNQAKEVLGVEVYQAISDVNASVVYCEATGQIYKDQKNNEMDKNVSWYKVYLSTNHPFSYSGVELDYASGTINNLEGLTKVNFDKIGIAGGEGTLSVTKISEKTDHISLDIELKNADRNRLTQSLKKSSPQEDQKIEDADQGAISTYKENSKEGGRIDFSLQAEGPLSEARHFEGSGNFEFYDVEIGTMHLLGGIRSKLGAFNLPLPSDALSFNRLNAPFLLDHDRILFDQATLSGPLSTFDAKGEVNWIKSEVDLLADLKLAGNLNIPVLKQLVNLADPLSRLSTVKIKGDWENPEWTIHLKTNPLTPKF